MIIRKGDVEINLTPEELRHFKIETAEDISDYLHSISKEVKSIGYKIDKKESKK